MKPSLIRLNITYTYNNLEMLNSENLKKTPKNSVIHVFVFSKNFGRCGTINVYTCNSKKINAKQISTEKGIHLLYCFIIYQNIIEFNNK